MLVKGVEWKVLNFKLVPTIAESLDPNGAQSQTPPKVLLIYSHSFQMFNSRAWKPRDR